MAYEMVMPYHLHMPSYFLETFTEYPYYKYSISEINLSDKQYTNIKNILYFFKKNIPL